MELGSASLGIISENLKGKIDRDKKKHNNKNPKNQKDLIDVYKYTEFDDIELLKSTIVKTVSVIILTQNLDNDIIFSTEYFTVQIFKNAIDALSDAYSIDNKLPLLDLSGCEKSIRNYYGWSIETDIPISKIVWDPKLVDSHSIVDVSYLFYNPFNGTNIDSSEICKEIGVIVKIPTDTDKIDIDKYIEYKNQSIDILDATNSFFTSRCIPFTNKTSNSDVTLGDRRDLIYQNQSISCSIGCNFQGLDEKNYAICDCYNTIETKAIIVNTLLLSISESNIDIFICYRTAFNIVINLILIKSFDFFIPINLIILNIKEIYVQFWIFFNWSTCFIMDNFFFRP